MTVCTQNRACLFVDVADDRMQLNRTGQVAKKSWLALPDHFPHVRLDEFVIMPNHVHGIIWIVDGTVAATVLPNVPATVPTSVGAKDFSPLTRL